MDLGTFPLVWNTPVFSFYFQSLKNSSFVCVPAAPIPAFLIHAQSTAKSIQKPLDLVSNQRSSLENGWEQPDRVRLGSAVMMATIEGCPLSWPLLLDTQWAKLWREGQYFCPWPTASWPPSDGFSSQILLSPIWEEGLPMWPVCK